MHVPSSAAPLAAALYRAWSATWRYEFDRRDLMERTLRDGPAVFAFWHGEQMPMVRAHGGIGVIGMASWSADGDLLARIIARLGYEVGRGSSSFGGAGALRAFIRAVRERRLSPALAVDGPRGPFHEPRAGALAIAAATGRPLLLAVSEARPAIRLPSWDRFVVPLPFARVRVRYARMEPPAADRNEIESARADLKERMEALAR